MRDPAFPALSDALVELLDFQGEFVDEAMGVRSRIMTCTIELPIELDVSRSDSNALVLGSSPPIYAVDTTYRPSYHRIRITATRDAPRAPHVEMPDGG